MINLSRLSQKRFHVLGYGITGQSVARALKKAGKEVSIWDDKEDKRAQAERQGFAVSGVLNADVLVVSPGIVVRPGAAHDMVEQARKADIEITNDIGLFRDILPNKTLVAITGTNGKSTTTALIGHILQEAGIGASVGGNLGTPVMDLNGSASVFVLELSSYQLETAPFLKPDIAILMNITPDHIDHHGSMDAYKEAKMRIFEGAKTKIKAEELLYREGRLDDFDLTTLERLRGEHNWQNVAAAFAACRSLGLSDDVIWKGVQSFPGLPHRQFLVRRLGEIDFVNDSKATNADATQKALRSFKDIFLIAGGLPKEGGLDGLENDLDDIREVFLIGQAQDDFAGWLDVHNVANTKCDTMDKAVAKAFAAAQRSGGHATVLLSPACASFDQFRDFPHRGQVFEELVNAL